MEEALRSLLATHDPLIALVGAKVRWALRYQGDQLPGVVLDLVSDVPNYTMTGPNGFSAARVQIDCLAATIDEALAIGRVIEALLSGYRGTHAGVRFSGILLDSRRTDSGDGAGGQVIHRVSADYQVWFAPA